MRRGLTLIELMIAVSIMGILVLVITFAYSAGMRYQQLVPESDAVLRGEIRFEERLRDLIEGAYLAADITDQTTYFLTLSSGGELSVPDTLVFTTIGVLPSVGFLESDEDFETLNERYGPQGGITEVSLSTVPFDDAPVDIGLFIRIQQPADGDPTQGGLESVMLDGVDSMSFLFFDGSDWVEEWDTLTQSRRLPAAVAITYIFEGDPEEMAHTVTIRLPHSDVTQDDPVLLEGAA